VNCWGGAQAANMAALIVVEPNLKTFMRFSSPDPQVPDALN